MRTEPDHPHAIRRAIADSLADGLFALIAPRHCPAERLQADSARVAPSHSDCATSSRGGRREVA